VKSQDKRKVKGYLEPQNISAKLSPSQVLTPLRDKKKKKKPTFSQPIPSLNYLKNTKKRKATISYLWQMLT
jgi:hypothetical protein